MGFLVFITQFSYTCVLCLGSDDTGHKYIYNHIVISIDSQFLSTWLLLCLLSQWFPEMQASIP